MIPASLRSLHTIATDYNDYGEEDYDEDEELMTSNDSQVDNILRAQRCLFSNLHHSRKFYSILGLQQIRWLNCRREQDYFQQSKEVPNLGRKKIWRSRLWTQRLS